MAGFPLSSERSVSSAFADFPIRPDRILVAAFAALPFPFNSAFPYVDRRSIEHRFDVSGVKFLDHLHAGPAVLGNLIDIGTLHQPEANIGVTQAVTGSDIAVAVALQLEFIENGVQQTAPALLHRKQPV